MSRAALLSGTQEEGRGASLSLGSPAENFQEAGHFPQPQLGGDQRPTQSGKKTDRPSSVWLLCELWWGAQHTTSCALASLVWLLLWVQLKRFFLSLFFKIHTLFFAF